VLIEPHEDDLAGRILADMQSGGGEWDVLSLPAIVEEDELLGREVGEPYGPNGNPSRSWSGSAEPYARGIVGAVSLAAGTEGDYFKVEWLKTYDRLPAKETLRVYGASDYAVDGRWRRLHGGRRGRSRQSHVCARSMASASISRRMD
jgi:hypothetical protein